MPGAFGGRATRDAFKADPTPPPPAAPAPAAGAPKPATAADIEAAAKLRAKLEHKATVNIWAGFQDAYSAIQENANMIAFEEMLADDAALAALAHANQKTQDAIDAALAAGTDLGTKVAMEQLGGMAFDWTMVNRACADWASAHAGDLIDGIDATTQAGVRASVARWVEEGTPLDTLIGDLEQYYSRDRAELIGLTETTTSFGQAAYLSYQASGVAKGTIWQTVGEGEPSVCDICRPLNQQKRLFGEEFAPGILAPAAHPRCRCATSAWLIGED